MPGAIIEIGSSHGYYTSQRYSNCTNAMLREDGIVRTCGDNDWGQIGNGTTSDQHAPYSVIIPEPIVEMTTLNGPISYYARSATGKVWRWGYNGYGQIGNGTTSSQITPYNSGNVDDIDNNCSEIMIKRQPANTYYYNCQVLKDSRDNSCWSVGYNGNYLLGDGSTDGGQRANFVRVAFPADVDIIQVKKFGFGSSEFFIIWLDHKGNVYYSGYNGTYGRGEDNTAYSSIPARVNLNP